MSIFSSVDLTPAMIEKLYASAADSIRVLDLPGRTVGMSQAEARVTFEGFQAVLRIVQHERARITALENRLRSIRLEEREACCAILASSEPNTRAELAIERIHARIGELPGWLAADIGEWLNATADDLKELQAQIRARSKTLDEQPAEQLKLGGGS
jgi:hypothetical protein